MPTNWEKQALERHRRENTKVIPGTITAKPNGDIEVTHALERYVDPQGYPHTSRRREE